MIRFKRLFSRNKSPASKTDNEGRNAYAFSVEDLDDFDTAPGVESEDTPTGNIILLGTSAHYHFNGRMTSMSPDREGEATQQHRMTSMSPDREGDAAPQHRMMMKASPLVEFEPLHDGRTKSSPTVRAYLRYNHSSDDKPPAEHLLDYHNGSCPSSNASSYAAQADHRMFHWYYRRFTKWQLLCAIGLEFIWIGVLTLSISIYNRS